MTISLDSEPRSNAALSIVSIEDYETLVAPREAFVDFLVRPYAALNRPRIAESYPPSA
jgi:hypothetical protein